MTSSREEMWRLFVAIPLNDEVRTAATASATLLQARLGRDGWRWVDPEMFHLTLAFLGNVPSSSAADLARRLETVATPASEVIARCGGVGAFPSGARARVVWYGVSDGGGEIRSLAARVKGLLGAADEAAFRPHITLARLKSHGTVDVRGGLDLAVPRSRLLVRSLVLYRSTSQFRRTRHEPIAVQPLA
ncbi:MAG TPA: RNA 2',3'-cyclic phosphodiesterase [Candidatus Limnocylindria bacterium]|nr:RNA 2',3'-cyclic phosphodiesterase [Candidatus Limnocylindria bacterium]